MAIQSSDMPQALALRIINELLVTGKLPDALPSELAGDAAFMTIIQDVIAIQKFVLSVSHGNLDQRLDARGFAARALKTLQANLRHLTWQAQQVAAGDFSQRVDFMGEFSEAFNTMVASLEATRHELSQREARLLQFNSDLQEEIARRERQEKELGHQARHDALTGLPNRLMLTETLADLMDGKRQADAVLAVMFIDLDRFKFVNDTLGHDAGDDLLVQTAHRLKRCFRDSDILCRMGGDEFMAVLRGAEDEKAIMRLADRILASVSRPVNIAGHELKIGASIGVSFSPKDASSVSDLVKKADTAMYRAKELGKNNCQFYSSELDAGNLERMKMERDLSVALGRKELEVHYQPRICPVDGSLLGFEAVLRWNHPVRGPVSPAEFIPIAEDTDLIMQLGDFALETVCMQQAEWESQGLQIVPVAVNLSAKQALKPGYFEHVRRCLRKHKMDPSLLMLEIPGEALCEAGEAKLAAIHRLREMGTQIVLDDFGTGKVPLWDLGKLPADYLKIDCRKLDDDPESAVFSAIAASICATAHNLGLEVIAIGIETDYQMSLMMSLMCDAAQGYRFCTPATPDKMVPILREGRIQRAMAA